MRKSEVEKVIERFKRQAAKAAVEAEACAEAYLDKAAAKWAARADTYRACAAALRRAQSSKREKANGR